MKCFVHLGLSYILLDLLIFDKFIQFHVNVRKNLIQSCVKTVQSQLTTPPAPSQGLNVNDSEHVNKTQQDVTRRGS